MKNFLTLFLVCCSFCVFSQNIAINTDGSSPDQSALLELKSDNRGFLTPRMTTVLRDAIVSPANGLLIYNTETGCFNVYDVNLTSWRDFCPDETPVLSCSSGMLDLGAFSIDSIARPATNFFNAVITCGNLGSKTRLCSWAEWIEACDHLPFPLIGNDWEWVDDSHQENNVLSVGGASCESSWMSHVGSDRFFRCCCEK